MKKIILIFCAGLFSLASMAQNDLPNVDVTSLDGKTVVLKDATNKDGVTIMLKRIRCYE